MALCAQPQSWSLRNGVATGIAELTANRYPLSTARTSLARCPKHSAHPDAHAVPSRVPEHRHQLSCATYFRGACPITTVLEAISVLGSSTILSAEIFIPFFRSETVAFLLPSTLNL